MEEVVVGAAGRVDVAAMVGAGRVVAEAVAAGVGAAAMDVTDSFLDTQSS